MINYCEDGERIDTLTEKLKIIQSKNVFSFSMDAVLLAHFAYIPKNGIIVDLCSGNGVIPLLLSDKTNSKIYGVEIQEKLVDMAHRSVELNNLQTQIRIVHEDLINSPQILGKGTVDLVTVNPPYLEQNGQEKNSNQYIATARHEIMTDLSQVITTSSQLLKIGGRLSMIHRPSRLVDIIFLLRQAKLEPKKIRFVHPNKNKEANMVLIEAYKNGGKEVTLKSPLIIYDENGKYSEEVNNIYFGEKMNNDHYIYILECSDKTYYTGYTTNIDRRFKQHAEGKASKYTRGRLPVKLVYSEKLKNRSIGLKREYEIKSLTRKQKEILIREGEKYLYTKEF